MTATVPRQGPPAQGGPTAVRVDARPGVVYGYPLRCPQTGTVRVDYVGRTRNLARRDGQHRGLFRQRDGRFREQPWADLIEGGPVVLASGVWTDAELDAEEAKEIRTPVGRPRPRYNWQLNEDNPEQIPIPAAQRQRDERDVLLGLPARDWRGEHGPGLNRPAVSRTVPGLSRDGLWTRLWATRAGRRVLAWLRTAAKVASWWAALSAVLTVALVVWGRQPFNESAPLAAAAVAALFGCALHFTTRPRRGGRTNRRRTR